MIHHTITLIINDYTMNDLMVLLPCIMDLTSDPASDSGRGMAFSARRRVNDAANADTGAAVAGGDDDVTTTCNDRPSVIMASPAVLLTLLPCAAWPLPAFPVVVPDARGDINGFGNDVPNNELLFARGDDAGITLTVSVTTDTSASCRPLISAATAVLSTPIDERP